MSPTISWNFQRFPFYSSGWTRIRLGASWALDDDVRTVALMRQEGAGRASRSSSADSSAAVVICVPPARITSLAALSAARVISE